MKKVVILAYDFPPNKSIGGARPESWMLHLEGLGIKPYLVSRIWEEPLDKDVDVVRPTSTKKVIEPDKIFVQFKPRLRDRLLLKSNQNTLILLVRKLLTLVAKFTDLVLLPNVYKEIQKEADELIKRENVDVVIATGEPFLLFKVANNLAKKNKIKWVADYRDCWTSQRVVKDLGGLDRLVMKYYTSQFEKSIVSNASLITTPAPSYARDIQSIFPNKKVEVVYNGYFNEKVSSEVLATQQESSVLTLAYIGILYPHQKLELFLQGVSNACSQTQQKLKIVFYGLDFYPQQRVRVEAFEMPSSVNVVFTPKIPYSELIKKLKESNVCVALSEEGADWLNTKIFDYLLANREVLLVENDKGILEKIIEDTKSGKSLTNADEIAQYIRTKLEEFEKNGKIKEPDIAQGYSRFDQSKRLAELVLSLL